MTAYLDSWAATDHDPTSHTEASRHLSLVASSPERVRSDSDTGAGVDELAVLQVAEDGLRLRLRGADRDEAIRRMHGRLDAELIAWRLHTTSRTVQRVASRLGLVRPRVGPGRSIGVPAITS